MCSFWWSRGFSLPGFLCFVLFVVLLLIMFAGSCLSSDVIALLEKREPVALFFFDLWRVYCLSTCVCSSSWCHWFCMLVCFIRALLRFQQSFSHIATSSWCDREHKAHFRVPPHWNITPKILDMIFHPVILHWHWAHQFWFLALFSYCWVPSERAASTIFKSLVWLGRKANPHYHLHPPPPPPSTRSQIARSTNWATLPVVSWQVMFCNCFFS